MKALYSKKPTVSIVLCEDDILALLIAISNAPIVLSRKVVYLCEKLHEGQETLDNWSHSVLNKDEDRALRYWYLTRQCSVALNEDNWSYMLKELRSYHFGINTENINRAKVCSFANSTVIIRHSTSHSAAHSAGAQSITGAQSGTKSATPKLPKKITFDKLDELLALAQGDKHED